MRGQSLKIGLRVRCPFCRGSPTIKSCQLSTAGGHSDRKPESDGVLSAVPLATSQIVCEMATPTSLMQCTGTAADAQLVDSMQVQQEAHRFKLQYFFPNSSVGETGRLVGPSRREIGHGDLAERSLAPVLPPPVCSDAAQLGVGSMSRLWQLARWGAKACAASVCLGPLQSALGFGHREGSGAGGVACQ